MVSLGDGGVLFAKNSDRDPNEAQVLDWEPAATHPPGATVRATWIEVPQVAETRAVLLSRPWWLWGAEMGANDAGVVIGNEAVFTRRHEREPGLIGMDLLRLALERAGDRHEAVGTIVELLERHGQGGACSFEHRSFSYDNSFLVADPDGAVVLETAGRAWATEEVGAPGRSISNELTIAGFAAAHTDPVRSAVAGARRRRRTTAAAACAASSVGDLAAALRSHGRNPSPRYRLHHGAMDAPCMHAGGILASSQTTASWIADLRPGTPDGGRHWVTATAAPCTSLFKPVAVHDPLDMGVRPTNVADGSSRWWRHELLHRAVMTDPLLLGARYLTERDRVERSWFEDPPGGAAAFAVADALTERWARDVRAGVAGDRRPWWVRRLWAGRDRAAQLPGVTP
jgi:dipeptidase